MVSIASILLLAAILSYGYGETTVSILEDPVLLEFNATHTALRCSIEVHGNVRPIINFFFNNLTISDISWERCNGVDVPPFSRDDSSLAGECGNSSYRIRHQVFFVRTCFGDPAYTRFIENTVVQCAPSSTAVNLTATSNRVKLTYNERHEPRLVPETVPLESLRVQEWPVCPGEPVGVLSLQSPVSIVSPTSTTEEVDSTSLTQTSTSFIATTGTVTPSTIPGPSGSSPDGPPTPSVTPPSQSPSASTTPPSSSNPSGSPTPDDRNQDGESISTFTEEELKLIIFVATGVAVFFAGVVVLLLCVLCCVLTKRRKNTNLSGSRKSESHIIYWLCFMHKHGNNQKHVDLV